MARAVTAYTLKTQLGRILRELRENEQPRCQCGKLLCQTRRVADCFLDGKGPAQPNQKK